MTRDDEKKDRTSLQGERLLESLRYELAMHEIFDEEPTEEELRQAEPAARYWQTRASERRSPRPIDRPREELIARVHELGAVARAVGLAYLANTYDDLERVPTEDLHEHLVALEAAIAVRSSGR